MTRAALYLHFLAGAVFAVAAALVVRFFLSALHDAAAVLAGAL